MFLFRKAIEAPRAEGVNMEFLADHIDHVVAGIIEMKPDIQRS